MMKKIAALCAAMALALSLDTLAAAAVPTATLLFASGADGPYALAAVRDGVFALLDFDSDERNRTLLRYQFGETGREETRLLRGLRLVVYSDGVEGRDYRVRGLKDDSTGSNSVLDLGKDEAGGPGLFSTSRLRSAGVSPALMPADRQAARALVEPLLARLGVPRRSWQPVLAAMKVQPVRIRTNAAPVLVIEGEGDLPRTSDDGEDRVLGFLLIAENKEGRWTPAFRRTYLGSAPCSVTRWQYLDHADLDADGTDELVIATWGWETYHPGTIVRRDVDGRWKGTGAGDLSEGHC